MSHSEYSGAEVSKFNTCCVGSVVLFGVGEFRVKVWVQLV